MTIPHSVIPLLGFARKGSKLAAGESAVESALKRGNAALIILTEDLPEKRKLYWRKWSHDLEVPCLILGEKEEMGRVLGMSPRSIIAVTDKQLAAAILQQLST